MTDKSSEIDVEALKEEKRLERELPENVKESIKRAEEQPIAGRTLPLIRERLR